MRPLTGEPNSPAEAVAAHRATVVTIARNRVMFFSASVPTAALIVALSETLNAEHPGGRAGGTRGRRTELRKMRGKDSENGSTAHEARAQHCIFVFGAKPSVENLPRSFCKRARDCQVRESPGWGNFG